MDILSSIKITKSSSLSIMIKVYFILLHVVSLLTL